MTEARRWRNDCKFRVFSEELNCTVHPIGGCEGCKDFEPRTFSGDITTEDYDCCAEEIGDVGDRLGLLIHGEVFVTRTADGRILCGEHLQRIRLTRPQRILKFLNARWQVLWQVWSFAAAIALPLIAIGIDWDRGLFCGLNVYLSWMLFCFYEDLERVESFPWNNSEYRGKFFTVLFGILLLMTFRSF